MLMVFYLIDNPMCTPNTMMLIYFTWMNAVLLLCSAFFFSLFVNELHIFFPCSVKINNLTCDKFQWIGILPQCYSLHRPTTDVNWAPKSTVNATETTSNVIEDLFVVLESTSTPVVSSLMLFTDPLEEISNLSNSGSTRVDGSSAVVGGAFNDLDPLGGPWKICISI